MQNYGQKDEEISQLELIHVNSSNFKMCLQFVPVCLGDSPLADDCERSEQSKDYKNVDTTNY
jgi:hypothetical protein